MRRSSARRRRGARRVATRCWPRQTRRRAARLTVALALNLALHLTLRPRPPHPPPSTTLLPSQVKRLQRRLDEVSSQLLTAREGRATATLEIALLGDRKVTRTLALTLP